MASPLIKLHDPEALLRFCGVDRGGLYHCPYRYDKKASFSIFQGRGNKKYIWMDKSDGTCSTGGDLIHLIMALHACDKSEAFRRIAKWDGSPQINLIKARGCDGYSAKHTPAISKFTTASEASLIQHRHYSESRYLRQYQLELPEWVWAGLDYGSAGDASTAALVAAFPGTIDIRPRLIPAGIEGVKDLRDAYNLRRGLLL